ncbi:hypothetical protein YPPY54_1004, partial [Yersinia pestis PY-54]
TFSATQEEIIRCSSIFIHRKRSLIIFMILNPAIQNIVSAIITSNNVKPFVLFRLPPVLFMNK